MWRERGKCSKHMCPLFVFYRLRSRWRASRMFAPKIGFSAQFHSYGRAPRSRIIHPAENKLIFIERRCFLLIGVRTSWWCVSWSVSKSWSFSSAISCFPCHTVDSYMVLLARQPLGPNNPVTYRDNNLLIWILRSDTWLTGHDSPEKQLECVAGLCDFSGTRLGCIWEVWEVSSMCWGHLWGARWACFLEGF